jgi:hypothetical protein
MNDEHQKRKLDRSFVNVHEEWERKYWQEEFGTNRRGLAAALKEVGNYVPLLRDYFRRKRQRS